MERAAGHLARGVLGLAGRGYGLRVAVLCGRGNNGGDGLAAAARLLTSGAQPVVHVVGGSDRLDGQPAVQLACYRALGGRLAATPEEALAGADVAVDCLLGTGAKGEPRPAFTAAIHALDAAGVGVVACDLPSGVDALTGAVPGAAARADLTVTLGARKRGLALWPARGHVGREVLGELGIVAADDIPAARVLEPHDAAALLPAPASDGHKRSRGVVVVLAGSPGMAGAAILVARGAMAAGAGLVIVATADPDLVTSAVPEALTARVDSRDGDAAFATLAAQVERADALAVGPGLGHDPAAVALVRRVVRELGVPLVLDADGLNAYRGEGAALSDHAAPLLACTPHTAELIRLVDDSSVHAMRAERLPELAEAWGAVLVAKGAGSMIAAPDGRVWINPTGSPALSSGGTGDVLTGMAAALLAQRTEPAAVAAAVYLHGLAGEIAGEQRHPRSVTALDVAGAVPLALRRIMTTGGHRKGPSTNGPMTNGGRRDR